MFHLAEVQGNIVRGYVRRPRVRHLVVEIADRNAARRWLAASVSGGDNVPQITPGDWGANEPATCFNIGLTYEGLRALGAPDSTLATFPNEFVQGMHARALKLGDVGESAPEKWPIPFNDPKRTHLVATIYASEIAQLNQVQDQALAGGALRLLGTLDGCDLGDDLVHFGYRDNLTQPRFAGVHDAEHHGERYAADGQPKAPLGTLLLGHPTNFEGLRWSVPEPEQLGRNGTFNAFRVLKQDVVAFEEFLGTAADYLLSQASVGELLPLGAAAVGPGLSPRDALREVVAANICGRWRPNGTPLALSPDTPNPSRKVSLTDFDYDRDSRCPYGAHIRRCNPRGGQIVQRMANNSRRLVRRGVPYGPLYVHDPEKSRDPQPERGLLGNFIGASLGAQFEAMSCDWLNLGLQDPQITGSNDPMLGANHPDTSWFDVPLRSGRTIRLRGLPRFVQTRGGAYTFLPSLKAIRFLGSLNN